MEENNNKSWLLIVVFFLVTVIATGLITYFYTSKNLDCGKSSMGSLFVINTPDLPIAFVDYPYETYITATFLGANTELTATLPEIPNMDFEKCEVTYNSDVATSKNTTIRCKLSGTPVKLDDVGTLYNITFSAPKFGKSITKSFLLQIKYFY